MKKYLLLMPLFFPVIVNAAEETTTSPFSASSMLVQVIVALVIVTASILALGWLAKRLGAGTMLQQRGMRIISSLPLSTREKIILVEVQGKKILLGVAPGNISSLHVFDGEALPDCEESITENNDAPISEENKLQPEQWDFARYIKSVLKDGNRT